MFPSDENQHRAKRPNLFSSSNRSGATDDNILARLERGAASAAPADRTTRTRLAVMGFSGLLVAGLIGVLIILAQDNRTAPRQMEVVASVVTAPLPPDPVPEPQTEPVVADTQAVIVEQVDDIAPLVTVAPALAKAVVTEDVPRLTPATVRAPPRVERVAASVRPVGRPVAKLAAAPRKTQRPSPAAGESTADIDVTILAAILSQTPRHASPAPAPDKETRKPR